MKSTGTERRRYPRSRPDPGSSVRCESPEAGDAENLAEKLIDVSAVGACIQTTRLLREGLPVQLEIVLGGPRAAKAATRGLVRWSQVLENRGREIAVAGVEFESVVEALVGRAADSSLLDVFLTLRVAVAQLRLYPKESPQVLKVVTDTYHSIHSFLENASTLTLSKTPKGLLVNGRPTGAGGTMAESLEIAMLSLLADAQVKSITFRKGVTLDELITFLHALTRKFWDVKDGKEINRRLRDERVLQITVDEVTYVALGEGDIVIEGAAQKLAGGETELEKLVGKLDQLIDSASSEGLSVDGRLHIMKKLLEKDPTLLNQTGGGARAEAPSAEEGRLSFDQARDAVGVIARLLRETPASCHEPLRKIGKILVDSFRDNPRLMAMMSTLLSSEAADAIPAEAREEASRAPAEPPAITRASGLLRMGDEEKIGALAQEGGALLDELAALGRQDMVRELLSSLSAFLGDRAARRRLQASRAVGGLRRAYERNAPDEMLHALERDVRAALDQERDATVYLTLAEITVFLAELWIRRGTIDRARELVEILQRHYKIKDPTFGKRGELAYTALERLASSGLASLSPRLRAGEPEAARIVEALGAAATRLLLSEIKEAEGLASRLNLAGFIARAGPGAATILLDEIAKSTAPSDVLRLIEVLPHAMPPDMVELAAGGLLRHAAAAVRKRTALLVSEQGYPRGGTAILEALAAEIDGPARVFFVECLGRLRHRAAVEPLSEMAEMRGHPEDLRAAACLALGRIGDVRAVAPLARLCGKGEKGITRLFAKVPGPVRAAAVRALAMFASNPDAREAIRRAEDDADPAVRAAASQARVAPLFEAFGDQAHGVVMISNAADLGGDTVKVGGTFSEVPLETACRKIAAGEGAGLLLVQAGGAPGRIYFDAGLVIAAEHEGRRDQEACAAMLSRRDGHFLFVPGERPPERRILVPIETLLDQSRRPRTP